MQPWITKSWRSLDSVNVGVVRTHLTFEVIIRIFEIQHFKKTANAVLAQNIFTLTFRALNRNHNALTSFYYNRNATGESKMNVLGLRSGVLFVSMTTLEEYLPSSPSTFVYWSTCTLIRLLICLLIYIPCRLLRCPVLLLFTHIFFICILDISSFNGASTSH